MVTENIYLYFMRNIQENIFSFTTNYITISMQNFFNNSFQIVGKFIGHRFLRKNTDPSLINSANFRYFKLQKISKINREFLNLLG